MANTTLNTVIKLRYDSYENWQANSTVVLQAGEAGICNVPASSGTGLNEPATLMKIGNGTSTWAELPWISGLAADVVPSLKGSNPTLPVESVTGLDDYLASHGAIDTDTQYQIVKEGDMGIKLQSKAKGAGKWTDVVTVTLTPPVDTLVEGSANGTVAFNGEDVAVHGLKSAAYTESSDYDAAGAATAVQTTLTGTADDPSSATTIYGAKKYAEEKASAAQTAAQGYADSQIGAAKTELIGEGDATSTTIKGAVSEAKTYTDTTIAAKIGSAYKAAGSTAFADLPTPEKAIEGYVYNVTDAFTADTKFITSEQSKQYPAGTNVVVVEVPGVEEAPSTYAYDVLTGMVDLSAYATTSAMNSAIGAAKTELIGTGNTTASTIKGAGDEAKSYADTLNSAMNTRVEALETSVGETPVATQITTAIQALDHDDTAVPGQVVVAVDTQDGISVPERRALTAGDIPDLTASKITDLDTTISGAIDEAIGADGAVDTAIDNKIDKELADSGKIDTAIDSAVSAAIQGLDSTASA